MMNNMAAFVLGLLIGWLVEWILDWVYWRRRLRATSLETAQPTEQNTALFDQNKLLAAENVELKAHLGALQAELKQKSAPAILAHLTDAQGHDNLQAIKGIGPAFAKRLKEAGVDTFDQLSRLTPQEMEQILGTLFKRFFSKENTILAQAGEFAKIKAEYG